MPKPRKRTSKASPEPVEPVEQQPTSEQTRAELDRQSQREREACPACQEKRIHSNDEWANHPNAGKGFRMERRL